MAGASEELSSPHNKVKLLCNYGGRILSRPSDGKLRYVGGETRIIAVNREITFSELMPKVLELYSQTVTVKYQLPDEDLDALISLCSDADIENLMDDKEVGSRTRLFLFSSADHDIDHLSDSSSDFRSSNRPIEAVKRSESGASDRMRDLDDLMGLYLEDAQSASSLEEAVPAAPQLLNGVSLMERHLELSSAPSASSTKHTQFISFQSISSSSVTDTTETGVRFPEEHVGATCRVQSPSAVLASGFSSLDSPKCFESQTRFDHISSATEDHSVQQQSSVSSSVATRYENRVTTLHELHSYCTSSTTTDSPKNQRENLEAEQQSLVNFERYDFKKTNPSSFPFTKGCADAQQESFLASHMAQFAQYIDSHSDVRFKDLESQHQKDHLTGFTVNRQTCTTSVSSPPLDRVNSVCLSEILSDSLHPVVDVFDQGHDGNEPLNETPQTSPPNMLTFDQHPLQQELIARQQLSANRDNLFLEKVGAFDTQYQNSPLNAVQLEAASEHELQETEEGRHLNLQDSTEIFEDQQYKVPHLKAHPTSKIKPMMEQSPSLSLRKMKQKDLIDMQLQQERKGRDDLSIPVVTNSGLVQLNYLNLELNQKLEASHQTRATSVDCSDCDRQLELTSLDAQPIKVQFEQLKKNLPRGSNDLDPEKAHLDPEKCPLQPGMIQLNKIDAMSNLDILSFSRTPNKVGPMERLESSHHNDLTGSACLVSDKHCDKTPTTDVVQEAQAAAENLVGGGAVSHMLSDFHGNESHKDEGLHTPKMVKEGVSELQETCEQIEGRKDTEEQLNAHINHHVQEEVLLEDYAVNAEVTKETIFEIIVNADLEERRELGSGTFGTVYYGKWKGCDVAIKRLKSSCFSGSISEQERLKSDFWTEACILAQLHHPNVVAFYGVVPDGPDGTLATVTEFMVNGSLKQVLQNKSDRILFFRRRLFIAMDSAFGMEYLHSKNIVHFDLKCENLLVNMRDAHRPICKVGDFGLSKVKQRTLVSGGVRGTLPWMAPELLNGNSSMVSEKVDVFSFGIVMWELLTGEEPYADLHYGAILGGILSDTLRPPVPEGCDPAWRLLMERCWSADPFRRPSFAEITSALRLMAASQPVKVQQPDQVQEGASKLLDHA
ncbi:hypothetical protein O6H91_13G103000 [Diphasiastrum complanatum]|uniref:Uncharacterized protein n=1 Tax=Diphasiastrum complanatum TaxID=34168 RepID=A0ACC2BXY0_DIPCM|nr:hypothetical protein O6H91_13G103000 [Diphasiastrum complanatum]